MFIGSLRTNTLFLLHNRIAGNHEKWDADTITFYEGEDFAGDDEMYDDVNTSADDLNNPG